MARLAHHFPSHSYVLVEHLIPDYFAVITTSSEKALQ